MKVAIEINGIKFGLRITPEAATRLVEALHAVWVSAASTAGPSSETACRARNHARDVFSELVSEVTFAARKSAAA
jgi:hypothetical protein